MSKFVLLLLLILMFNINAYSQKCGTTVWPNLKSAIESGSDQYINYKGEKRMKYEVFVIKVISISKNRGTFSISYILDDDDYKDVNASNYLESNNRLVLIRTDSLKTIFTEKSGLPLVNDSIRKKAYSILAGLRSEVTIEPSIVRYNSITAQAPSVMVFNYKRKKVTGKYFGVTFLTEDKYMYYNDER